MRDIFGSPKSIDSATHNTLATYVKIEGSNPPSAKIVSQAKKVGEAVRPEKNQEPRQLRIINIARNLISASSLKVAEWANTIKGLVRLASLQSRKSQEEQRRSSKELQRKLFEDELLQLAIRAEEIDNTCQNLTDVFTFNLKSEKSPEQIADKFIEALDAASKANPSMAIFAFDGTEKEVSNPHNQNSLVKLDAYFKGDESEKWKEALLDHLYAKKAKVDGKIHISSKLMHAINQEQTREDTDMMGDLLMSEVCETKGGKRLLNSGKLEKLLAHERIKDDPQLEKAVLEAAKRVQLTAICATQVSIIWGIDRIEKQMKKKLTTAIQDQKEGGNFSIEGLLAICQTVGNLTLVDKDYGEEDRKLLETLNEELSKINQRLNEIPK